MFKIERQVTHFLYSLSYLVVFLYCTSFSYAAENSEAAQEDLEAVTSAIGEIQSWLSEANQQQSNEEERLREAELEIASVSEQVTTLQTSIAAIESELAQLQQRQEQLAREKAEQDEILAQVLRAAYMAGDQDFLKILLNQEDITRSARMMHYYQVFSESQIEAIQAYQATLDEMDQVNTQLESSLGDLGEQRTELDQQALALNEAKDLRQQALAELNADIASRSSELEQLEINRAELEDLLAEIARAMEGINSFDDISPFTEQQGNLPYPANGMISSRFGSPYGDGNLTRQGITIGLSEGTPVRAIHGGRVVFSDWLRGSGLLVIIDHGDGYMSLYGANQALAREAGQWVDRGDIVATSGNGGENGNPGLYFEIRHHGEAQNPGRWLQSSD